MRMISNIVIYDQPLGSHERKHILFSNISCVTAPPQPEHMSVRSCNCPYLNLYYFCLFFKQTSVYKILKAQILPNKINSESISFRHHSLKTFQICQICQHIVVKKCQKRGVRVNYHENLLTS